MTLPARSLALAAALVAAGSCSAPEPESERKVLVIGWDGATYDLIDPLVEAGHLPHLAGLMGRGTTAELDSTIVPISSAAWVGAVTGMTPGETGVYDFFEPLPNNSYKVRLVSSKSNKKPPLWRILGWHGMQSLVFGVPLTWPPEEIDGVMVAGMLSPFEAEYAHPPGLADELRERGFVPDLGIWRETRPLTGQVLNQQLAIKRDVLLEMLTEREWDFAMIVFKSLDVLGHRYYDGSPTGDVAGWCTRLDAVLGELLEAAGPDTDVIVLSDHGFRAYPRLFFTHRWLIEEGFAVERRGAAKSGSGGPLATARAEEHDLALGSLDLSRTRAYAGAAEGNFGGVRLNLRGREQEGVVAPEEVDVLLTEIAARLRAVRIPGTDTPLVTDVKRATDLYPGRYADRLPDLLFETHPSVAVRPVTRERSFVEMQPGRSFPDHARTGIWIAAGPSFTPAAERGRVDIFDLAPTVLHALGLPVHHEMHGAVREEMFAERRPVKKVARNHVAAGREPRWADTVDVDTDGVMERLQGLGYTEGIDDGE